MKPSIALCLRAAICGMLVFCVLVGATLGQRSIISAPDRRPDEGAGPFDTLLIKNAMVINGTGAPPIGPMNIVIKQNRIESLGGGDEEKAERIGAHPRQNAKQP